MEKWLFYEHNVTLEFAVRAQCDDSKGRSPRGGNAERYPGMASRLVVVVLFNTLGGDEESSPKLPESSTARTSRPFEYRLWDES